jgi:polyisoprenyl-phosphate glycosyltransferase
VRFMAENVEISIVVPIYCESICLKEVIDRIKNIIESVDETYEIILIDDGSPDDTWNVIEEISLSSNRIRGIKLSRNFGKEAAICAGLDIAVGRAVIIIDGDLQHPPELIAEMVHIWRETQADIVEAVKVDRGNESVLKKISTKIFYDIVKIFSGFDLNGTTDYKLVNWRVVEAWRKMGERNLFFRGMIAWLGFKHVQIPFSVPTRVAGQSRWSLLQLVKLAVIGITAFTSFPLHFVTMVGIGFLFFAIVLGCQTLLMKISGGAVSGFATVILLLLIIGSCVMIGLGIIGEYIARIYEELKARPRYIIADSLNNSKVTGEQTSERGTAPQNT